MAVFFSLLLRAFAERVSRGVVLKRHLPSEFGGLPIYVSPDAGLRYWFSMAKVDPVLYRMVRECVKPGATVWDIGANVGLFSVCASVIAGNAGCVVAVEPDVWLCHLLAKSAASADARGTAKISVLCAAISDRNRIAQLEIAVRSRSANYLADSAGSTQTGGIRFSQPCSAVPLDFLLDYFPPPSVLKIDVETHEIQVLRGAQKLITTHRPTILCEVDDDQSVAVSDFLHQCGYDIYAADGHQRIPLLLAPYNTLAIPRQLSPIVSRAS